MPISFDLKSAEPSHFSHTCGAFDEMDGSETSTSGSTSPPGRPSLDMESNNFSFAESPLAGFLSGAKLSFSTEDVLQGAFDDDHDDGDEQISLLGRGATGYVEHIIQHSDRHPAQPRISTARKVLILSTDEQTRAAEREMHVVERFLHAKATGSARAVRGIVGFRGAKVTSNGLQVHVSMEYMDRGSAARLAAVPEPVLAAMAWQLLHGLRTVHEKLRVLHRDIKPENILLNSLGEVKLADFGVAAVLEDGEELAHDQVGTILQMSPERLRGEAHGPASDVWSLGVTLAQLALGRHPFVDSAEAASTERFWLLAEVIKHTGSLEECEAATREVMQRVLAPLSPHLQDFLQAATATDPAVRATISDLLFHPWLTQYCDSVTVAELITHPWLSSHSLSLETSTNAMLATCFDGQ